MRTTIQKVQVKRVNGDTFTKVSLDFMANLNDDEGEGLAKVARSLEALKRPNDSNTGATENAEKVALAYQELGQFIADNFMLTTVKIHTERAKDGSGKQVLKQNMQPAAVREAEKTLTREREEMGTTFSAFFSELLESL